MGGGVLAGLGCGLCVSVCLPMRGEVMTWLTSLCNTLKIRLNSNPNPNLRRENQGQLKIFHLITFEAQLGVD